MFAPQPFGASIIRASRRVRAAPLKTCRGSRQHSSRSRPALSSRRSYLTTGAAVLLLGGFFLESSRASDANFNKPANRGHAPVNSVCSLERPLNKSGYSPSDGQTSESAAHADIRPAENISSEDKSNLLEDQQDGGIPPPKELFTKDEPLCFVIGTGIDASHKEFEEGQIIQLSDPTDDSVPVLESSTFRIPQTEDEGQNCWAHETKVASVIAGKSCGVAPGTKLVDVRVATYDSAQSQCTYQDEEMARRFKQIQAYLEANPGTRAVINLSMCSAYQNNLGQRTGCVGREEWTYPTTIVRNPKVDKVIRDIHHMGTLTIASSGNGCSPAFTTWPASNPYVLSVGALDRNGVEDEVSNFGANLLARGVDVRVAYLPPDQYDVASGTSYAAPYVAGMACTLLTQADTLPGLRTAEVRPGGLKSLLMSRFYIKQFGRTQPEHLRRRSDGEVDEEVEESGEDDGKDDEEGHGEDDGGGDVDETVKARDTPVSEDENDAPAESKAEAGNAVDVDANQRES